MDSDFARLLVTLIAIAVGFALVLAGLVFAGGARRGKRYRPGRPFTFRPVWFLAAPEDALPARTDDAPYVHELEGWPVRHADGAALGVVSGVYDLPAGLMLEVQGPRREFLLPLRDEFVRLDTEARVLVATPPDGLLD